MREQCSELGFKKLEGFQGLKFEGIRMSDACPGVR